MPYLNSCEEIGWAVKQLNEGPMHAWQPQLTNHAVYMLQATMDIKRYGPLHLQVAICVKSSSQKRACEQTVKDHRWFAACLCQVITYPDWQFSICLVAILERLASDYITVCRLCGPNQGKAQALIVHKRPERHAEGSASLGKLLCYKKSPPNSKTRVGLKTCIGLQGVNCLLHDLLEMHPERIHPSLTPMEVPLQWVQPGVRSEIGLRSY